MIRKVNGKKARQSRWIGQLLIVLALSSLGCARGDWTTETLTLADVTGMWEGMFILRGLSSGYERSTRWILQQNGQKVRGEVQGPDQASIVYRRPAQRRDIRLAPDRSVRTGARAKHVDQIVPRCGDGQ